MSLESVSRDSCTIILEEKPAAPFTKEVEDLNKDSGLTFDPIVDSTTGKEEGFIVKQPGSTDDNVTGTGNNIDVSMKIPAGKRCCVSISMDIAFVSSASVTLKVGNTTYGPLDYGRFSSGEHYFGIQDGTLKQSTSKENVWFVTDSEIDVIITGQRALSSVVVKILVDNDFTNS